MERRLHDPVLRSGVDRVGATERIDGNAQVPKHVRAALTPSPGSLSPLQCVSVRVGRSGHLPLADHRRVGRLARIQVREDHVALGLHDHHGHVEVVADRRRCGERDGGQRRLRDRRASAETTVYHETVVYVLERLDRVDVGDQTERRLRLTGGEHPLGREAAEQGRGRFFGEQAGTTEDAVRVAVARMQQRGVPGSRRGVVLFLRAFTPTAWADTPTYA